MSKLTISNITSSIARNIQYTTIASVLLVSCGGPQEETLESLKTKQAELKTQLSEITNKISKLQGDSGKAILVEAVNITPSVFKTFINVQGRIDAEESVSLSSEMPGTITKIHVQSGDEVKKGQVLAETDSRVLMQSISDLETNAELVNQLYEKQRSLWEQKIGTEVQYLQAKTQKESIEKKLATLQEQLRMTKIISPIDGTVDAVDIKLGQLTAPGMPAIRVINFNNLKVKADLAESYISKVKRGDEVLIKFPDSNDTLTTKISYAARAINPMFRTFNVEIMLDNKKEYHPNQVAILQINDYRSAKPVISVPLKYILKDLKGDAYVMIADNNKAKKQHVHMGKEYNGNVEILEGLTETDLLIVAGQDGLEEGDLITLKK